MGSKGRSAAPAVAPSTRLYAVGDIHGRADLLDALHRKIEDDANAAEADRKLVVYLGDYIDRGPESRRVIDRLSDRPLPHFEAIFLKGNHEAFLLRFLEDESVGQLWLHNGGAATLKSYGLDGVARPRQDFGAIQKQFRESLPATHLRFLEALQLMHVEGDYLFVHAGIRPGIALDAQDERDLLWIRDEFLHTREPFPKMVVHGHTIHPTPVFTDHRIGIDTGAFATGTLTALVLQGERKTILQVS
ncbi:MAG: metallophosphoesterase family protein [Alphaproteobacteria bacterium]